MGAFARVSSLKLSRERRPHAPSSDAGCSSDALAAVDASGYSVLHNHVPPAMLAAVRETEAYRGMPRSVSYAMPQDAAGRVNDEWRPSAFGRYHRIEFGAADSATLAELESLLLPLARAFFGGAEFYRSELQLLTAAPDSGTQIWHSDNRARGITVVVPLEVGFSAANGGTQVLPGSHQPRSWGALRDGARVMAAPLGSVGLYDARTYHRGLGNETAASRPALVFRWDAIDSRPPGVGVAGTLAHACAASAMHVLGAWATVAAEPEGAWRRLVQ